MKTITVVALLLVAVCLSGPARAQEAGSPVFKLERFFAQVDWADENAPDEIRRIRPRFTVGNGRCFGRVELDLAKTEAVNGGNGNWLEIGELVCNTGANSQVRMGRLFLNHSTPPPFLLRTVEYAGALPFKAFAYGVQWQAKRGEWWLSADLTGDSGLDFDDARFTRLEGGLRVTRATEVGTFGLTGQVSDEFVRAGLDYNTDPSKDLGAWLGLYYNDHAPARQVTGLALVSYQLVPRLRPHLMYDWRPAGNEEVTAGAELQATDRVRLVGDYEVESGRFLLRTQFKF
ncbi:MAG TPA: hypothetical protein VJ837_04635 [Candidatus Paceibacterota bacterium]|nr:hypothetical protein [Candidatus Paceibacterota bacterium]